MRSFPLANYVPSRPELGPITTRKGKHMAKKAVRGERSQAIRDYLAANPEANISAVVAGLAEKGITVKPGLVSAVKYTKPKTAKGVKARRRMRTVSAGTNGNTVGNGRVSVEGLLQAKKLIDAVGGIEEAKMAIATLERLR